MNFDFKIINKYIMYKISCIICLKNNQEWIKYFMSKVKKLELKYDLEYYIYENNSTDDTKSLLKSFIKNRKGELFSENIKINKFDKIDLKRCTYMTFLRNRLKKIHGTLLSDYTWIIDSNIVFKDNLIDNFINLSKNKVRMITPFVICQSFKNHYYDTFALISKDKISYKDTMNTCLFKNCIKCKKKRIKNKVKIHTKYLLDPNIEHEVLSSFGSCAFLKTNIYNKCNWSNKLNNQNVYCEHFGFCNDIRKYCKIFLIPNIKIYNINIFKSVDDFVTFEKKL